MTFHTTPAPTERPSAWTVNTLTTRAARYGLTLDEYTDLMFDDTEFADYDTAMDEED